ncbi:unnamed protein product [Cuscuta europaea]|uniref:Uncharacterized protein n=1 Tax=Cuscuta europaea TaxID=41803 RepID=A0A9P0ZK29_CUSEU|nr:unnamed protein product [Cuscuta europaea]
MKRGSHFVDMGNLHRNQKKEIVRTHPSSRKGKGRARSPSQRRDDFETDYQRRDADAMSDEQLTQLLAQQDGAFTNNVTSPTLTKSSRMRMRRRRIRRRLRLRVTAP